MAAAKKPAAKKRPAAARRHGQNRINRLPADAPALFAAEYIKDFSQAGAYMRAFSGMGATTNEASASVSACRLMRKPEVQEAIRAAMQARVSRVNVDADRVLLEVARLALSDLRRAFDEDGRLLDPKDWPDELAAAVASVESVEEGGKDGKPLAVVRKLRAWDKPAALTLAMRHLGMLVDRKEVSGPNGGPIRQESNVTLTPAEAYRAALGG